MACICSQHSVEAALGICKLLAFQIDFGKVYEQLNPQSLELLTASDRPLLVGILRQILACIASQRRATRPGITPMESSRRRVPEGQCVQPLAVRLAKRGWPQH